MLAKHEGIEGKQISLSLSLCHQPASKPKSRDRKVSRSTRQSLFFPPPLSAPTYVYACSPGYLERISRISRYLPVSSLPRYLPVSPVSRRQHPAGYPSVSRHILREGVEDVECRAL